MTGSPWPDRRRLIPRWRSLAITTATNELAAPYPESVATSGQPISDSFLEKCARWKERPGVITAGELVGAALVIGREEQALDAARLLLSPGSSATRSLRRLAELTTQKVIDTKVVGQSALDYDCLKRQWRRRARMHPENAMAWVELSLLDVILGREKTAQRSMSVALQLAPNNRHVLRSAARLFLHFGDPVRAYEVISKSEAVRSDPWLIAAELAIAELAKRKPKYYSRGRDIVGSGATEPRQLTELAGAIGTLELIGGQRKKARQYFRKSVVSPTGNALAQAEWASPSFGSNLVEQSYFKRATEIEEARVLQLLNTEEYSHVPDACDKWSSTEPYAIRPYEISSSVSAMLEDFDLTLKTAQRGLRIHPKAGRLLNNCAFSLASLGRLREADSFLLRIGSGDGQDWPISEANRGLVAMRRGQHDLGVALYRSAIDNFGRIGRGSSADIASIYLAREAARSRIPDARTLVNRARDVIGRLGNRGYEKIMKQAERALSDIKRGEEMTEGDGG